MTKEGFVLTRGHEINLLEQIDVSSEIKEKFNQFQKDLNQIYDDVEVDVDKIMNDFHLKLEVDFKEAENEAKKALNSTAPIWKEYENFRTTVDNELTTISNKMKRPLSYSLKCCGSAHKKDEKFPGTCLDCSGFYDGISDLPSQVRREKMLKIRGNAAAIMIVYQNYMKKKELAEFTTPDV